MIKMTSKIIPLLIILILLFLSQTVAAAPANDTGSLEAFLAWLLYYKNFL